MRGSALRAIALFVAVAAVLGCHHDKYKIAVPAVEEYKLPPDEKRYNEPDTAGYRKPPPAKEDKSLLGKSRGGGPGGFGPGGF